MNPKYLLQGIFLSSIVFGYIIYKVTHKDYINQPKLIEYLRTVHPYMYKIKLNSIITNISFEEFVNQYKKSLHRLTKSQLVSLKSKLESSNNLLKDASLFILNSIPWKFYISHNNLENSMPYTIGQRIIIPESKLDNIGENTLIHEKIHILQRRFQSQFNNLYTKMYPFLHKMYDERILPITLKMINMTNPDGNNTYWVYKLKNKYWLPLLIYDTSTSSFVEKAYEVTYTTDKHDEGIIINTIKSILLRSLFNDMPEFISLYHPNEIFACELSQSISDNQPIHPNLLETLNNLI
jgi:hypothetical protein